MIAESPKLFMVLLGAKPIGRHIEQHDVFFGIGRTLKDLVAQMHEFWPEAKGKMHVDAYRIVSKVGEYKVDVIPKSAESTHSDYSLYFLNLGGYRKGDFDELHYKMLTVADEKAKAIKEAKLTAFYKHTGFEGAVSHIDDKYGVDVDDLFDIEDVLSINTKAIYQLKFSRAVGLEDDELFLGYLPLSKI